MLAIALSVFAVGPRHVIAGAATDALRPAVDQVLHILADPALKDVTHTPERRRAIRAVIEGIIDFQEAARRALGVHWRERTDAERDEFVALFKELVTYSYVVTMEGSAGHTVLFVSESENDGLTTVGTKIQSRQGPPVPVEYRMHQRAARWLVYDVLVEGVSLVGHYRTQFNSIIRTTSYAELIHRMRSRVDELKGGPGPAAFSRLLVLALLGGLP